MKRMDAYVATRIDTTAHAIILLACLILFFYVFLLNLFLVEKPVDMLSVSQIRKSQGFDPSFPIFNCPTLE